MKRLVIISDTHVPKASRALPQQLLDSFQGADMILHAGDIIDMALLDQLSSIAPTIAVAGNMDLAEAKAVLPEQRVIQVEGKTIGLTHGSGGPGGLEQRVMNRFSDVDAIVFGHSHRPLIEKVNGILLLNPGSPNDRRFGNELSYIELVIEDVELKPELIKLDPSGSRQA